jgi:hypothetical protein
MAYISAALYKQIADDLAKARLAELNVRTDILDAVEGIVDLQVSTGGIDIEPDLLDEFWSLYQSESSQTVTPAKYLSAISVLNQHVIDKSDYTDINDFISTEGGGFTVYEKFADMSSDAGWTIDHDNTEPDPTVTIA